MADNFLEKRYREVFGGGTRVNPETGFEEKGPAGGALAAYRKATKPRHISGEAEMPDVPGASKDTAGDLFSQNFRNR